MTPPDAGAAYNLIIAVGQTPPIVTETIWSLAQPPRLMVPRHVEILTTSEGRAFLNARLFGKADVSQRGPVDDVADRWGAFCKEVLGGHTPSVDVLVPPRDNELVDDIRTRDDDRRFANLCYRSVYRLTRKYDDPLIGSIAGGRKTMSAHLMTAFCVYGRKQDQLVHILVDPFIERDPDLSRRFYYPTGEFRHVRIDRVDPPYPRLYHVLHDPILAGLGDVRDLDAVLAAIEFFSTERKDAARPRKPARLNVVMGGAKAGQLQLFGEGGEAISGVLYLTLRQLATFLVLAEHTLGGVEEVSRNTLLGDVVHAQREAVTALFYDSSASRSDEKAKRQEEKRKRVTRWTYRGENTHDKVSRHISELRMKLRQHEFAGKYLRPSSTSVTRHERDASEESRKYGWEIPLPTLRLEALVRVRAHQWPFSFLPLPVPIEEPQ